MAQIIETYAEADGPAHETALAEMRSIDLTAPARMAPARMTPARSAKGGSSGRLTLEDFSRDGAGLVLECPSGVAPVSTSAASAKRRARLDLATCRECPDWGRAQCRPTRTTGNSFAFNPRQHGQKTRNDDLTNAAIQSGKSIVGARASKPRCHA